MERLAVMPNRKLPIVKVGLVIETAFEAMGGGEMGSPVTYFARGGHFTDAFVRAIESFKGHQDGRRLIGTRPDLLEHVRHLWWLEEPSVDDYGEPDGSWIYQECGDSSSGAYPVTTIDAVVLHALTVDICSSCVEGSHHTCRVRTIPKVIDLVDLRRPRRSGTNRWVWPHPYR